MTDVDAWLVLNAARLTVRRQNDLLDSFGDAETVKGATDEQLLAVDGITARHLEKLRGAQDSFDAQATRAAMAAAGVELVTRDCPAYPKLLAETEGSPPMLFVQGRLDSGDAQAVAIVGTRKCTPYGRQVARRLAADLARRGFCVVSGMAEGIDAEAHLGALEAGGRTIAVMASGPDVTFPSSHRGLREQLAEAGAVVTEYAFGSPPLRERFPERNRLISGMSLGTVVVEAPRRSGALITARLAAEQGRGVFAVPGPIDSPASLGCHSLIRDGAELVETAEDIVEGLGIMLEAVPPRRNTAIAAGDLSAEERQILDVLSFDPRHVDAITEQTGLGLPTVNSTLMMLEMKALVRRFPGNAYVKIS
jgi:DNA processing protein